MTEHFALGDLCSISSGRWLPNGELTKMGTPVFGANGIIGHTSRAPNVPHPAVLIGRVGSIGAINLVTEPVYATDNALICAPGPSMDANFLSLALRMANLSSFRSASIQPLITARAVRTILIPRPDLEDQRRIAGELDLLLASVEIASSQTSRMRAETRALRTRAVEASFESLDQSRSQPLGQLGSLDDGDWILTNDYAPTGVRLFQVGDIGRGELLAKSDRFVSMERATELRCTILRAGDVLISRMPDPIGRACALPKLPYPSITAVDVTIFRPDTTRLDTEFVVQFMNSGSWLADVTAKASGATRQRISRANMELLRVPVPPLVVQQGIAAELRDRLAVIDAMETAIRTEQEAIDALPAALLRRAFSEVAA